MWPFNKISTILNANESLPHWFHRLFYFASPHLSAPGSTLSLYRERQGFIFLKKLNWVAKNWILWHFAKRIFEGNQLNPVYTKQNWFKKHSNSINVNQKNVTSSIIVNNRTKNNALSSIDYRTKLNKSRTYSSPLRLFSNCSQPTN